jgi:hypothetical protein
MKALFWNITVAFFILTACNSEKDMKLSIIDRMMLDQIPSASGIEHLNGHFWVIGDNSPWLFELTEQFIVVNRYKIFSTDSLENNVIPKKRKHDFEAMTGMIWEGDSALFIFGSGSKAPDRNSGKLIQLGSKLKETKFDLTEFYSWIKEEAKLNDEDLNIEAAAVLGKKLYLFNRGKNNLLVMDKEDFYHYLTGEKQHFKIKSYTIDLPNIEGTESGFSGATADEENNRLIFTASVENTANWIADGAVLGSFVGTIDVDKLHNHYVPTYEQIKQNNEDLLIKVESITIRSATQDQLDCILVTDSDGGNSELIEITLKR